MHSEIPFRVALVIVLLMTVAVTAYHRLQAASSKETISRKEEGILFASVLRLAGASLFAVTIIYLLAPSWIAWSMIPLPTSLRWFGVVTGLLCSVLMYWTLHSLGKNLTDTVVTRANATLVTNGPYRWVRHPFYVTSAMVMASVTLITSNSLIGILSLIVLSMLTIRTPLEERMLMERFGEQYTNYMARTGRFLPRIFRK
jgi:protein-S-isoprenylcysteine O-methyltransferase Ste14